MGDCQRQREKREKLSGTIVAEMGAWDPARTTQLCIAAAQVANAIVARSSNDDEKKLQAL
jgi:hypothetical protein